ncbi:hypothetical protein WISP_37385 [Willisornis vidua]|uniref:Uncharacterized protein n=1 Tax=Willisornis vidua TaxID=1566151 RepID=A0ABQ9DIR8_9PASS|nr:hypothetical protein WISP_37385 [Willisornis vidua]
MVHMTQFVVSFAVVKSWTSDTDLAETIVGFIQSFHPQQPNISSLAQEEVVLYFLMYSQRCNVMTPMTEAFEWKDTGSLRRTRRRVIEKSTRRVVVLDLVLTNKERLVGDVKVKDSLGCSDHEMVKFEILRAARREHSKLTTLEFRRAGLASLEICCEIKKEEESRKIG